jgi:cell division protein FtsL
MSRSITINREELIQDIKIGLGKYKFYFAIFFSSLIMLVGYSQLNYKIDNEIVQLNQEKNYLIAENFKLKKDIAILSSPERISQLAKNQQGMKSVDYKSVKFIENKP